jgi:hypothetical protein
MSFNERGLQGPIYIADRKSRKSESAESLSGGGLWVSRLDRQSALLARRNRVGIIRILILTICCWRSPTYSRGTPNWRSKSSIWDLLSAPGVRGFRFFDYLFVDTGAPALAAKYRVCGYRCRTPEEREVALRAFVGNEVLEGGHG